MTCAEARPLLGAHVDNELELRASLELEAHLRGCVACRAEVAELRALHEAARAQLTRFAPSPGLQARLDAVVRTPRPRRRLAWLAATVASGLAVAAALLVFLLPRAPDRLRGEILDAHARSLLVDHATDVSSGDQHTVKPWFQGKLAFGVPVASFAEAGFPLVGGRLDYVDGRAIPALVYRRRNHIVNAFVWPQSATAAPEELGARGFSVLHWADGGFTWWLVSDASVEDLHQLRSLIVAAR